ncbi:2-oxo-4-hydroxy-4-carboxy-5-ureidoimidazoline decarboxylase [Agarivorans albus]|uniref:2-oxo-4-hydroxy-4-carboxy-5-ureidoimidazoline decarboxylase n=1 Tax=Agarivorans albus MKT 106 TaxID=1331007 RepID=R9PHS0_AGAAL|nr:2-oxo-4-hydroxy-4-carboxy-5-ureidoimidazoline decarboxylase [Agarivorans albus]GAD00862.1 2-oxo-4-hydroxy-4-carboxy--5-ureidoimidazoline (OHCU) decarboxylase [Agarivorans albus MKT 106]
MSDDEKHLKLLNNLPHSQFISEMASICSSKTWQTTMATLRPFQSVEQFMSMAKQAFSQLTESDWLEAFAGHPMIGDLTSLQKKYNQAKHLSEAEQAQVNHAQQATLSALLELNQRYLSRYGFIFIVFASGKSAEEMLHILEQRCGNSREQELHNAAEQQQRISLRRMENLF